MENDKLQPPAAETPDPGAHPEEMRATFAFRYGERIAGKATARATPAGLIATAILISAILIPTLWFARQKR